MAMTDMNKKILLISIMAILIVCAALAIFFMHEEDVEDDNRIVVGVTILPQADIVRNIMGDRADIIVMTPPGADPHTYEPSPDQLRSISNAKIYFKVGSGIDFEKTWMDKLEDLNPNMIIVDGSKDIKVIDNDPHIWLSPLNAITMTENFYDEIVKIDPDNTSFYEQNKNKYVEKLAYLDKDLKDKFSRYDNKAFLTYHPSFGYLAKEYDLVQISVESEGKEPTPQDIRRCVDLAKELNLSYVFLEPQFPKRYAEAIASEIGGEIVYIDPLPKNYIENMTKISDMLILEFE